MRLHSFLPMIFGVLLRVSVLVHSTVRTHQFEEMQFAPLRLATKFSFSLIVYPCFSPIFFFVCSILIALLTSIRTNFRRKFLYYYSVIFSRIPEILSRCKHTLDFESPPNKLITEKSQDSFYFTSVHSRFLPISRRLNSICICFVGQNENTHKNQLNRMENNNENKKQQTEFGCCVLRVSSMTDDTRAIEYRRCHISCRLHAHRDATRHRAANVLTVFSVVCVCSLVVLKCQAHRHTHRRVHSARMCTEKNRKQSR